MIKFENVSFKYDGASRFAVEDINLEIKDGEFVGIIGRSGAGKTTLTYAINGIVPHYFHGDFYGAVRVGADGGELLDTAQVLPDRIAEVVGSVLQDTDAQMITPTVKDEVRYGLEGRGYTEDEIERRTSEAMAEVGIEDLADYEINALSGGQRQKVAIASITAMRPQIIVLDEPTGELDPQSSRRVFELLRELNGRGITVIVVEQKIMQLCEFCKRLIVADGGKIRFDGGVREVLEHSAELEEIGVHIPRTVSLYKELAGRGLPCGSLPVGLDEAEKMVGRALLND